MSLYGGIKFSTTPSNSDPATSTTTPSSASSTAAAAGNAPQTKLAKAPAGASSVLKFAPRINKKPAQVARPVATSGAGPGQHEEARGIVRTAEPVLHGTAAALPSGTAAVGGTTAIGAGVGTGAAPGGGEEIVLGPDGLPLAKAPAMTLAKGKGKGWKRDRNVGDGQRKKKKKKKRVPEPVMPTFDPNEPYDPNHPNDLGEYQQYRKRQREERRAQALEEKRRRAEGLSSEESSYYTDSSEEAPRRDAPRMFAPPKAYSPPSSRAPLPRSDAPPPPPPPPSVPALAPAPAAAASGDDAYARRAAIPHPATASSGDEAYARRLAMSQQQFQPQAQSQPSPPPKPQGLAPPTFQPPNPPSQVFIPGGMPPFPPSRPPPAFAPATVAEPPEPPAAAGQPSRQDESGQAVSQAGQPSGDFQAMLEERKKAAAAVAAKFKALAAAGAGAGAAGASSGTGVVVGTGSGAGSEAGSEVDSGGGSFAEKMMRRWGHKEGTGLGADGSGILHALSAEHTAPTPSSQPGQPLSKRALAKQKAAAANLKNHKWVQAPNARGRIVNTNAEEQAREEREKKGEASRVVCLRRLVGGLEDIDEELAGEIGDECSKYGIVERVVLHMVEPPPPEPEECLRVFVVFSGMAGAWRATKELDGRFFGGETIQVTYFDEAKFDAGDRDGPI